MNGSRKVRGQYGSGWSSLLGRAVLVSFLFSPGCHTAGRVFLSPSEPLDGPTCRAIVEALQRPSPKSCRRLSRKKYPRPVPREEGKPYQPSAAPPVLTDFTPVLPPPEKESPIDLKSALSLAGVENPQIALAQEIVRENLALQLQACALLVPSVTAGGNYHMHNGILQTSTGFMRQVDSQSLYTGLLRPNPGRGNRGFSRHPPPRAAGRRHLCAEGRRPRCAEQQVRSRRGSQRCLAERGNDLPGFAGAEGRLAVIRQSEADFREVVRLTDAYARAGQGREGDANRARTDALRLHIQEQGAEEEVAVASADLSRLLHLDPSKRLYIADGPIQVVQLVDSHLDLEQLLDIAMHNRPEIGARNAAIAAAQVRYRQERARPLLPLLSIGYSDGFFAGGSDQSHPSFGRGAGRGDFDVFAVWTLQNVGFGNLALQKQRKAQVGETQAMLGSIINQVRREVAEAQSRSVTRFREVDVARRQVETALAGLGATWSGFAAARDCPSRS